jgi:hypothetical protein
MTSPLDRTIKDFVVRTEVILSTRDCFFSHGPRLQKDRVRFCFANTEYILYSTMKLLLHRPATLALFLLHNLVSIIITPGLQAAAAAESCTDGVVYGSFTLKDISGPCSYSKLLDEYTRQVYNVTGSISNTCQEPAGSNSLSAKEDLDFKLIAAMPNAGTPEEAAMSICRAMYDNPDLVT